jgi:hypothetical protein
MTFTSLLGRVSNRASRAASRRRWLRWLPSIALAIVVVASADHLERRADAHRESWGATVHVWVADHDLAAGDLPSATRRRVPVSVVPDAALGDDVPLVERVLRRPVGAGEILTTADVVVGSGPLAAVPAGWRAVPIGERVPSGALVGDRVDVASDGLVVVADAVVVERFADVTLIAVPSDRAAMVALADTNGITLLRSPFGP